MILFTRLLGTYKSGDTSGHSHTYYSAELAQRDSALKYAFVLITIGDLGGALAVPERYKFERLEGEE